MDGARLSRIGDEIWAADRELILPAGRLPIRMVVLRDSERRLSCYSPVSIDSETLEALEGLGAVACLVVPNRHHRLFLPQVREVFPSARVIGWDDDGGGQVERLATTDGQLAGFLDYRVVHGSRRFSEIVLYHDVSETLIVADLIQGPVSGAPGGRGWRALTGLQAQRVRPALRRSRHLRDDRARTGFYHWAMARPFRQIAVAHGELIRDGAREVLYGLFRP